jgi:5'-methylthioadenosine nucleosidase
MNNMGIKRVLLIMAMQEEAKPTLNSLGLKRSGLLNPHLDLVFYTGNYRGTSVNLVLNGTCKNHSVDHIGTQVSTLSAHLGIELVEPDIVINAGTAGGFISDNAAVGDVYLSNPYICYHDRRINIPKFVEYGIGFYPSIPTIRMAKELGLRTGVISTGNSLDYTEKDLEQMRNHKGVVKDMEAAAIAWVCEQHKKPFLAIKAITDLVDGDKPTEEEFLQNLNKTSEILGKQTLRVVDWLIKNGIDEE